MDKYLAEYFRLSLDDDGIGESNSISSQRQLIDGYISTVADLADMPTVEFVDDGYTGTNFDRPGVKRLFEAVRRGEVSCIVVKDLSRFGRKYLEVSKYIEQLFPYLGVRFIAINDHYDSYSHKGTTAELDIPIRNMINAMYSKDVSKKAKSAKQTQARQGKCINAFAPYGYNKDEDDKHRLVIDEPAAEIVRRVFALACDGHGPTQIANTLNADGIPTPSEYNRQNGSKRTARGFTKSLWSGGSVRNILRDERYTGVLIAGKVEMGALGTGKRIAKPKEEWIRVPDAFPAIISSETWETSVAKRPKNCGAHGKPDTGRMLYMRLRCGHCGHVLRSRVANGNRRYFCKTPRYSNEHGCTDESYSEQAIVDVVKAVILKQVAVMLDLEKLCRGEKKTITRDIESAQIAGARLEKELVQLQAFKRQLYERYKGGNLEKAAYLQEREAIEANISAKTAERDTLLAHGKEKTSAISSAQQFFGSFSDYQAVAELSPEMVNSLVEAVYIYGKDRFEILFTFRDELEQAIEQIEELRVG